MEEQKSRIQLKQLPEEKRYNMYIQMLKYDPRVWRQEHHIVRILVNVLTGNFVLFSLYKLYYHYYDIRLPLAYSILKPKFFTFTAFAAGVTTSLVYLNYKYLPALIYDEFYSKTVLSDNDFLDLYDHLVTKKKLIK
jgi:hypothetical protein